jgi:hypothetical protein
MPFTYLPLSIAAAGIHGQIPLAKVHQIKAILAKTNNQGVEHEVVLFEGVRHGFAVRADENEGHERESGKQAESQAVEWFTTCFELMQRQPLRAGRPCSRTLKRMISFMLLHTITTQESSRLHTCRQVESKCKSRGHRKSYGFRVDAEVSDTQCPS